MSPAEAAQLLDLPPGTSSDQVEARFLEFRAKLEARIASAPTSGLKEKYREALARAGEACDTLLNSAPSDLLPTRTRVTAPPPALAPAVLVKPDPLPAPPAPVTLPSEGRMRAHPLWLAFPLLGVAALPLCVPLTAWWYSSVFSLPFAPAPDESGFIDYSLAQWILPWRIAHYPSLAAGLGLLGWLAGWTVRNSAAGWRMVAVLGTCSFLLVEVLAFIALHMTRAGIHYGAYSNAEKFIAASPLLVAGLAFGGAISALLLWATTPAARPSPWWMELGWGAVSGSLAAWASLAADARIDTSAYEAPYGGWQGDTPIVRFTLLAGVMAGVLLFLLGVRWLWRRGRERVTLTLPDQAIA